MAIQFRKNGKPHKSTLEGRVSFVGVPMRIHLQCGDPMKAIWRAIPISFWMRMTEAYNVIIKTPIKVAPRVLLGSKPIGQIVTSGWVQRLKRITTNSESPRPWAAVYEVISLSNSGGRMQITKRPMVRSIWTWRRGIPGINQMTYVMG